MVKRAFTRAYGTTLRRILIYSTTNRLKAFFAGALTTAMLQSSTATTLLLTSFAKKHALPLSACIAAVIGADIATTLIAQILSMDMSFIAPLLLIIGILGRLKFEKGGRKEHIFKIFIGLGLMLLSLSLIKGASQPLTQSEVLPLILAPLLYDPLMAIILAAIISWVMHSSLAAILLFAALASNGLIAYELGLLLTIGTNIGGAMIAFIATYKESMTARRITATNISMRVVMAVICVAPSWHNTRTAKHPDDRSSLGHFILPHKL